MALVVGVLEVSLLKIQFGNLLSQTPIPAQVYGWTGGFAGFAFFLHLDTRNHQGHGRYSRGPGTGMPNHAHQMGNTKDKKYFLYGLIVLTQRDFSTLTIITFISMEI